MTSILIYLVLPYIALGLVTYVVFARLDEGLESDDQRPSFPKYAAAFWPLTWITFFLTYLYALIILSGKE